MINITAGIEHLKELTAFYKREEAPSGSMEDDLKGLNEKLRKMYDVVKSDPNYMKHNYKANASAIQALIREQNEYKSYRPSPLDEEDDDPQEWSDIFVDPLFSYAKIPAYNFISKQIVRNDSWLQKEQKNKDRARGKRGAGTNL